MMAAGKFSACLAYTLREEGGLSNDPGDPGGVTNKGITHATYDSYRAGKALYPRSVAQITDGEIQDIYLTGYWSPIGAEGLPAGVDLSAFDYAVNSGPGKARQALAKAMDGQASVATIIDRIASGRLSFMHALRTWGAFGKGWAARVARIEAASLKMAGLPIAPAATAARNKSDNHAVVATAGAGGAGILATAGHIALWIVLALVAIVAAAALIAAFNAWRQGQRATALDQAVADLAAKEKAEAAARTAAAASKTAASAAVTAEQQKIDAAKAAIAAAGVVETPHQAAVNAAAPAGTPSPAPNLAPAQPSNVIPLKGTGS
jgi:lysozyme family protein